jgi:hypothetical protein
VGERKEIHWKKQNTIDENSVKMDADVVVVGRNLKNKPETRTATRRVLIPVQPKITYFVPGYC